MDQIGKKTEKAEISGQFGPETGLETSPDVEATPEAGRTGEAERTEEGAEEPGTSELATQVTTASVIPAKEASRDPVVMEIERKLEDGLWDAYKSMDPTLRARFKAEGERVAVVAREGISSGRIAAQTLLEMIVKWLRMIPRVNDWFLVQDAKLKTDALIRMVKERSGQ